jgi:hypothetical protein
MKPVNAAQDEIMKEKTPLVEMPHPILGFPINGPMVLASFNVKELHTIVERAQLRHSHRNCAGHIRCCADKMKVGPMVRIPCTGLRAENRGREWFIKNGVPVGPLVTSGQFHQEPAIERRELGI